MTTKAPTITQTITPTITGALRAFGAALMLVLAAGCGGSTPETSGQTSSPTTSVSPTPRASPNATSTVTSTASPKPAPAKPSAKGPGAQSPAPRPLVVHIRNFHYVPAAPVVSVGQRIQIINDDTAAHTWSAAPKSGWTYTSGNLERRQRATYPGFSKPGRYKFLCFYHAEMPSMNGVVTVRPTR
jgi:plastocyanin